METRRPRVMAMQAIAIAFLVSGLVLPAVASYQAVYVTFAAAVVLSAHALITVGPDLTGSPIFRTIVLAIALMVLATLPFAMRLDNWLAPTVVAMVLLGAASIGAIRVWPTPLTPALLSGLMLTGAVLGAGAGILEWFGGVRRVGVGNNPIHYSQIVVILGFCSLAGIASTRSPWRYIFLLGPLCAFAAAYMSGSRGPMLATLGLSILMSALLGYWYRRDRILLILLALLLAFQAIVVSTTGEQARALAGIANALTGERGTDEVRRHMYSGGFQAFLDSPIWGHGYADMVSAAARHMPDHSRYTRAVNLHSDQVHFAAIGGILGLAAYIALMLAPLAPFLGSRFDRPSPAKIAGFALSAGFVAMGITHALIGVLPQNMLFTVLLGWVAAFDLQGRKQAMIGRGSRTTA